MFRTVPLSIIGGFHCTHSNGICHTGFADSLLASDFSVHSLREDCPNLCTEQSPKESDDTRCCTNTICPPEDEHNSARNM